MNKKVEPNSRYAEEELLQYLSDPQHHEDACNAERARMLDARKRVAAPDVDEAWTTFKFTQMRPSSSSTRRFSTWHIWGATLLGAAAMLTIIFLFNELSSTSDNTRMLSAITYKDTPQQIILEADNQQTPISQTKVISYHRIDNMQSAETPVTTTSESAAPAKMQKLSTPRGMDFKVVLSDGSEVWLNAESTIEFPAAFTAQERKVVLKGEAYFKVTHDEKSPFIVTSDKMKVKVLGTEFNFKSYDSEAPHVSLVKGAVEVMKPDGTQPEARLKPGQDAWADEGGNMHVNDVDTYGITQWVSGYFYFDNQPLVNVLCELGRWYNLGVVFKNESSMSYKMHFSASRKDDIRTTIKNLNALRKEKIRLEGNDIVVY